MGTQGKTGSGREENGMEITGDTEREQREETGVGGQGPSRRGKASY